MKPEHFCSGNLRVGRLRNDQLQGFNEAGAFLLRKRVRFAWSALLGTGFNEAGAFLLRKPCSRRSTRTTHNGFNEAGAFLLRKRATIFVITTPASSRFNEAGAFLLRKRTLRGREWDASEQLQ